MVSEDIKNKLVSLAITADNKKLAGCIPDTPDDRDYIKTTESSILPENFSLKVFAPEVRNQMQTSACSGFATAAAVYILRYRMLKQMLNSDEEVKNQLFNLSPLYNYFNARYMDASLSTYNTVFSDTGATLRGVMKGLKEFGVIPESAMPFNKYAPTSIPPTASIHRDLNFKINEFLRIPVNEAAIELCKNVLAIEQLPIITGVLLYSDQMASFSKYGYLDPVKDPKTSKLIGGHAICITGYKKDYLSGKEYFEFINSWGTCYGDKGYGYMPVEFMTNSNYIIDTWTFAKNYF